MTDSLTIRRPDDWHLHVRDGSMLETVIGYTAQQFARAIIMPNLSPPVTTTALARAYQERIVASLPEGSDFSPLMTIYLTDDTDPNDLVAGYKAGVVTAAKLYPAHATTNSAHGVTDIQSIMPVLEKMSEHGIVLCIHGEVTEPYVDIFDREAVFIDRVLSPLVKRLPELKIVFEHITTSQAASFVEQSSKYVAATVTPQHLHINRNAMFAGGLRPHAYCLPVAKREAHRMVLRRAVTSGSEKFFLGTDSAPHDRGAKESACGCAGIFNAPYALESYAQVFEEEDALDKLEAFASENGPRFYGLPFNMGKVTLHRKSFEVPALVGNDDHPLVPFHAGDTLNWQLAT